MFPDLDLVEVGHQWWTSAGGRVAPGWYRLERIEPTPAEDARLKITDKALELSCSQADQTTALTS